MEKAKNKKRKEKPLPKPKRNKKQRAEILKHKKQKSNKRKKSNKSKKSSRSRKAANRKAKKPKKQQKQKSNKSRKAAKAESEKKKNTHTHNIKITEQKTVHPKQNCQPTCPHASFLLEASSSSSFCFSIWAWPTRNQTKHQHTTRSGSPFFQDRCAITAVQGSN